MIEVLAHPKTVGDYVFFAVFYTALVALCASIPCAIIAIMERRAYLREKEKDSEGKRS